MNRNLILTIIMIMTSTSPSELSAWLISPITETLTHEKPQTFFTLFADIEDSPVAIEIYACDRDIDEAGKESEQRNNADFFIYPSNLILQPGQKRMVRVIWKGDKNIKDEKAYRLVAESLPVDFAKGEDVENNIKFKVQMGTQCLCALYVEPKGVFEKIVCKKIEVVDNGNLDLYIENQGSKHGLLSEYSLMIQTSGSFYNYPQENFNNALNNYINVLPHHTRKVSIELNNSFTCDSQINAQLVKGKK